MIQLSNGKTIKYVVSSGSLAFDGKGWLWERPLVWFGLIKPELFTVVLKSLTLEPITGNLKLWKWWTCIRLIPGGVVNKVGLTNKGFNWWCDKIAPTLDFQRQQIVVSLFGTEKELIFMSQVLNDYQITAIEVNVSCPNSGHKMDLAQAVVNTVMMVKRNTRHPVIIKVSVDQDYFAIAKGLVGVAEAISINSVPWTTAFPNGEKSPLWKLEKMVGGGSGGVSGRPAQKHNWKAVEVLAKQGCLPVIAPSIMEYGDMDKVRRLGAKAVSFGAIHLRTPCSPTTFVERENHEFSSK